MDAARVYLVYRAVVALALAVGATVFTLWMILRLDLDALQIILVGTVLEVVVTTCEIPTGVVADSVSRRLSVIVGVGLLGVGFIVFAVPSYPVALASQ